MSPKVLQIIESSGQTRREFENAPLRKRGDTQSVGDWTQSKGRGRGNPKPLKTAYKGTTGPGRA